MIDLLLLVASHWTSQGEFLKMTDHNEEDKNTEGQYNDQDLCTINKKWSRSMMMSCTVTGVEQRGEVANGQSEGLSIILLL